MFSLSTQAKETKENHEKAILAGGCFWGMEDLFRKLDGVQETNVGYIGDNIPNPSYRLVSTGLTNYAESLEITFDPNKTSYEKILKFFFTIHDPTQVDRQQNDVGRQYRSAIFYLNDEQKRTAESIIKQGNDSGVFNDKIVTIVVKAQKFWPAEDYHQDYLKKNPYGYTCHHPRKEWQF